VTSTYLHKCTAADINANRCGRIYFTDVDTGVKYSISKCNPKILNAIDTSVDQQSGAPLLALAKQEAASSNPLPQGSVAPRPPDAASTAALTQALTNLGVTPSAAQNLATNNPSAANDFIVASQTGNLQQIQNAAEVAGIKLNPEVANDISALTPEQVQKDIAPVTQIAAPDKTAADTFGESPDDTPTNTGLPTQCGIDGIAGNIMYVESKCGQINSNPLSSVQGPYHYLCGTWQADTNATGNGDYSCACTASGGYAGSCAAVNDPQISTQVVNARYGLYQQQYGDQCSSAGLTWSSCAYAIHVFGPGGFNQVLAAYNADPSAAASSLCGSALSNSACSNNASIFNNAGTVAGVFSELDKRLGGNGTVIPNVASAPASPFAGISGGLVNGGGAVAGYSSGYGSPFANVSPVPLSAPTPAAPAPSILQTSGGQPAASQTMSSGTSPSVPPVATIIVQPSTVSRGDSFTVSWSSVGMQSAAPCEVFAGQNSFVAQGNDGSKQLSSGSLAPGVLNFTLQCTAQNGQAVQQAATVTVN
jgi:hypothetical protein